MGFLKSSAIVSLGILSSRILGFVRDLLIARFLGAGINSDIFFIGLKIPNAFRQIFGEGAFNLAFIPLFKKYCDDKNISKKSLKFLEETFTIFMLAIFTILIVTEIFMPQIISFLAPGLLEKGDDVFNLAVIISRIIMPYIVFVSYMTFMGAVLNSLGKFAAMAFAPALVNVGYISAFAFVYIANIKVENLSYIPSLGMVFGGFLQFLLMYISIKRMPFKITFVKPKLSKEVKLLFVKFIPTILGSGIVILNSLVSVFLASQLEGGVVSYMFYADRMIQLPTALFATAIATVLLPTLTQKIKLKQNISPAFIRVFGISLIISSFCATYMYLYADIIINTLFERGLFDREATINTAKGLALMALSVPAIMNLKIISVIFYSNGNTKLPTIISGISFIINLSLCLLLMDKYGYLGLIAAGVIATYFTVLTQLIIVLKNKVLSFKKIAKLILLVIVFQIIIYFILNGFSSLWTISLEDGIMYKLGYLFVMGSVGLIFAAIYTYSLRLYKKVEA